MRESRLKVDHTSREKGERDISEREYIIKLDKVERENNRESREKYNIKSSSKRKKIGKLVR